MTPGRDWDKELARVDRSIAAGAGDVPATGRVGPAAAPAAGNPRERVFTWFRLLLALGLGIAMTQWPYLHGCGLPFFAYLGCVVTLLVASLWSMLSSWRSRSGVAHVVSIGLMFWGIALAAREILPRVGYAKTPAAWFCQQPLPRA